MSDGDVAERLYCESIARVGGTRFGVELACNPSALPRLAAWRDLTSAGHSPRDAGHDGRGGVHRAGQPRAAGHWRGRPQRTVEASEKPNGQEGGGSAGQIVDAGDQVTATPASRDARNSSSRVPTWRLATTGRPPRWRGRVRRPRKQGSGDARAIRSKSRCSETLLTAGESEEVGIAAPGQNSSFLWQRYVRRGMTWPR
jgi:hypothetical protein